MTKTEIIVLIKETKNRYATEMTLAVKRLHDNVKNMTSQQAQQEMIFISDMESRAYAMTLLLEEIEEIEEIED